MLAKNQVQSQEKKLNVIKASKTKKTTNNSHSIVTLYS